MHRSDGSGTTYIFTDYLSKVSPEWKTRVGHATSVDWPVGLGGKGNEGVTQQVKQSEGAIGYVELIYALSNGLPAAEIKNAAGAFVAPTLKGLSAAAAGTDASARHRLPGLDHQRAGRRGVSDLLLYLAADPHAGHDVGQAARPFAGSCLDARAGGAADGRRPPLRPAAREGDRDRPAAARGFVTDPLHRRDGPRGARRIRSPRMTAISERDLAPTAAAAREAAARAQQLQRSDLQGSC